MISWACCGSSVAASGRASCSPDRSPPDACRMRYASSSASTGGRRPETSSGGAGDRPTCDARTVAMTSEVPRQASKSTRIRAFLRAVAADFGEGELLTYASAIAFRVLLSVIPLALFATALAGFLGLDQAWTVDLAPLIRAEAGDPAFAVIDGTVRQVLAARQGFWLTLGLALTLWELSSAVRATSGAFCRIYDIRDERPFKDYIGVTVLLAIGVGACLLVGAFAMFLDGQTVEWVLGPSTTAAVAGAIASWIVAL